MHVHFLGLPDRFFVTVLHVYDDSPQPLVLGTEFATFVSQSLNGRKARIDAESLAFHVQW